MLYSCHVPDKRLAPVGFTDSNSGAQADNTRTTMLPTVQSRCFTTYIVHVATGGTCWSTGDVNAETWTYDEPSETMTIESIEGQDDRKTKLTVICSKDAVSGISLPDLQSSIPVSPLTLDLVITPTITSIIGVDIETYYRKPQSSRPCQKTLPRSTTSKSCIRGRFLRNSGVVP